MTIWPGTAHLYPVVPLVSALQSAGHEVVIASHPDVAATITSVGLTALPLGERAGMPTARAAAQPVPPGMDEELDRVAAALALDGEDHHPWGDFRQFVLPATWEFHPAGASSAQPMPGIDDLVAYARVWQPDLVVWDPAFPSAAVAARAAGAAHARLLWGPDYWGWITERLAAARADGSAAGAESPLARAVRPVAERHGVEVDEELLLGQWTIDTMPAPMRLPTRTVLVPMRWVPFTGAAPIPPWLREAPKRPRVALSLGVSVRQFFKGGEEFVGALLESVADLDIDVIATLDASQIADFRVPPNVRTVDYVPLTQLLPSCSAFIHHGGMGSFAAATATRTPQLIVDGDIKIVVEHADGTTTSSSHKHMDMRPTSAYVLSRGAGLLLDQKKHSVEELTKRLARVLDEPSFQAGARRIHEEMMATPSPHDLVPQLERLSARHRSRP
ncbi:nucleotide disphospho-sugar-binding domain-containing protein [Streptomyces johnsoniae]|uniref:DUF1205 domain-containing protein n=1 Tax=Streptomyces johnsoniae TaxID=3075532 RepID=A0ABU2SCU5_9ACTN|nr:nucleotide disphospho-sugar-binding domain-containing protein [Streptomyces sp. DSM 41886]MDT0446491.1 DUF1205 domain-containing protein [Streptomyces sp. DSM 41886]